MTALDPTTEAELRRFGWTLGPDFERRYRTDPWVFNLVNAFGQVTKEREALRSGILDFADAETNAIVAAGLVTLAGVVATGDNHE